MTIWKFRRSHDMPHSRRFANVPDRGPQLASLSQAAFTDSLDLTLYRPKRSATPGAWGDFRRRNNQRIVAKVLPLARRMQTIYEIVTVCAHGDAHVPVWDPRSCRL